MGKSIKRYQTQLREAECGYEEASRARQEMNEKASLHERRAQALSAEMEEARALLDSADRGKRQTEAELAEARVAVNEMSNINTKAAAEKRSLEGNVHTMQAEIDDMLHQAKSSEEKAKKAMVDAARLADELRAEQDHVGAQTNAKRALETELGACQSRTSENAKLTQKSERKIKEMQFSNEEDRKNQDRMSDLASKLQAKIKTYKKQIEEAEEIAALNLAKFRKAQQELEES